jgi:ABC-2 type transport system permease protein
MTTWLDAAWAVLRRDAIVFMSYRTQVISQTLGMLFQLTIFYFISRLLQAKTFGSPDRYFAFVVVGLAIMQVLVTTLGLLPGQVRQELVAGTMERFLVSPFGAINGIAAMLVFPAISALVTATILLGLATAIFGLPLAPTAPLAVPVAVLGAVAFMPFALIFVAAVVAVKQATSGTQFATSAIAIVGGLYFPIVLLPAWVRWTSEVQPFTPAADLLRHLLVDAPVQYSVAIDLLKLFGFAVALLPLAFFLLRRAVIRGQRRGTIIEY